MPFPRTGCSLKARPEYMWLAVNCQNVGRDSAGRDSWGARRSGAGILDGGARTNDDADGMRDHAGVTELALHGSPPRRYPGGVRAADHQILSPMLGENRMTG